MTFPELAADRIGVLIVDDQALVWVGFRTILEIEPDLKVVGDAPDGDQAVASGDGTAAGTWC